MHIAFFAICQNIEQNSLFMSLVSWGQCQPTAPFCPAKNEQKMNTKLDQALSDLRSSLENLEAAIAEQRAGIRRNGYITIPSDQFARYELDELEVGGWVYHVWYDYYPRDREYVIRQLWGCPVEADTLQPIIALHIDSYDDLIASLSAPHWSRYIDGCQRDD